MKKNVCVCFMALALTMLALGCKSAPDAQQQDPNTPPWFNEFPPEGFIWGIGSAKQSSEEFAMTTAEARARTSVARQLGTKVDAMFTDYMRDAGTVDSQTALSLQEDVSRQVNSLQLNGVQANARWKAPDGTYWYRVEYKISDAKTDLSPVFTSEEAKYAEFKAQEALRMLDSQLSKNEKPVPVFE
ncbi:MAG: LPP20 family lipoprotein [Treponema sp.]|jgi:hypothetical protein|nr:LPP20 family lipoprotein [Treponema sp.]